MTAHAVSSNGERFDRAPAAAAHVGQVCHTAIDGRRASRALAQWCTRFEIAEPELQVLWCLRAGVHRGFDQTTLVKQLAFSPAQVSATVERLRARGWILQQASSKDRRRNLWYLTQSGTAFIGALVLAADDLQVHVQQAGANHCVSPAREAA